MEFKIYTLNNPITNEVRYIGYTSTSLEERLRHHIKDCKYKKSRKVNWIKKLLSDNVTPTINLLYTYKTLDEAKFNEIKLIFEYRLLGYDLVNGTDGGEGGYGYKFTKEQILAQIKRQTGRKLPPCSEERKRNISNANKGRKMTEEQINKMKAHVKTKEHREKLSICNKGKKLSDETRCKMSESRKQEWKNGIRKPSRIGMKNSESHKEKMRGSNNPFYGKTHSIEMRNLISERVKEGLAKKKLLQQSLKKI